MRPLLPFDDDVVFHLGCTLRDNEATATFALHETATNVVALEAEKVDYSSLQSLIYASFGSEDDFEDLSLVLNYWAYKECQLAMTHDGRPVYVAPVAGGRATIAGLPFELADLPKDEPVRCGSYERQGSWKALESRLFALRGGRYEIDLDKWFDWTVGNCFGTTNEGPE